MKKIGEEIIKDDGEALIIKELYDSGKSRLYAISKKDYEKKIDKKEENVNLDLNGDGKVDKKDASIASKVMNRVKKKKKKK